MRGGRTQRCALRSALLGPLRGLRPQIVRRRTFEVAERAVDDLRKPARSSRMPAALTRKQRKSRPVAPKLRKTEGRGPGFGSVFPKYPSFLQAYVFVLKVEDHKIPPIYPTSPVPSA